MITPMGFTPFGSTIIVLVSSVVGIAVSTGLSYIGGRHYLKEGKRCAINGLIASSQVAVLLDAVSIIIIWGIWGRQ